MLRTPKVGTRVLAGIATCATVVGVTIPLAASAALAAVNSVTANPSTYRQAAGLSVTVTADISRTAGDITKIRYAIVSGPDADQGSNGTLVADGADCTLPAPPPPPAPAPSSPASCTFMNFSGVGTDVVRVFADTNDNSGIDGGEAFSDATVIFNGPAFAVDLKPDTGTAAAGTCKAFTVTATDDGGRVTPFEAVELEATMTGTITGRSVAFCDPVTTNPTSGDAGGASTSSAAPATGGVTTDSTGKAAFGIRSDQPGGVSVHAYVDNTAPAGYQAGEPSDVSTQTFTAGGTGNAAQDAVATLTVAPSNTDSIAGEAVSYKTTAKNSSGDTTPNVTVSAVITTGPNAGTAVGCSTIPNSGVSTCSYTSSAAKGAGTDSITFFVNQTSGATSGADANEPKATATNTIGAAPSGNTIDLTCVGTSANTSTKDCFNPTTDNNEVFTALVWKGLDANNKPIGVAGVLVRFTTVNANAPGTPVVSSTEAVTNASGVATTTLTDVKEADGTVDSVTATIAGQVGGQNNDTGSNTWETATPSDIVVTPALNTTQTGSASTFVATVTDQFDQPVAGVNTDFVIAGRNVSLNPAGYDKVTNASGQATFTYTDGGPLNNVTAPNDADTITARTDNVVENDAVGPGETTGTASNRFITEAAKAGSVDLDVKGAGTCGVTVAEPANDSKTYPPATAAQSVCALVKTAGGVALAGKTVTFTLSGVGSFVAANGTTVQSSPQTAVTDANGVASINVRSTQSGAQNLTAAIDGKSDSGTITYTSPDVSQARNIDLKPETGPINSGTSNELTARVTDRFGNPVSGVTVDFTESGPGQFSNGTSSATGVTGSTGTVSVTLTSAADTSGAETVTASINEQATNPTIVFLTMGGTQCGDDVDMVDGNSTANTPAGNCTDASSYTFRAASESARTIGLTPATATATSGNGVTLTASVKDAAGAGVAGVTVSFSETGAGALNGITAVTNGSGIATVNTTSASSEQGTQTVTASIAGANTDCDLAAGTPAGAPAGNCVANSTVTYTPGSSTGVVSINGSATQFVKYGTRMVVSGKAAPNSSVTVYFHRAYVAGLTPKAAKADANGVFSVVYSAVDDFSYYSQVGSAKSRTVVTRIDPNVSGGNRTVAKGTVVTVSGKSGARSAVNVHIGSAVKAVRADANGVWRYTFTVTRTVAIFANVTEHNIHTPGITISAR